MANCKNCLIIRYFLISVLMLILLALVFTDKLQYLSFINPAKVSYLIFLIGILIFLFKLYEYLKNKLLVSNKSNKVRNVTGKPSKSVSSKKIN